MPEPSWADRPWEKPDPAAPVGTGSPAGPAPKKSGLSGCLIWGIVGLVTFVGCTVAVSQGGDDDETTAPTSIEAERQCQDWVRDKLVAPATAEFSGTVSNGGPVSWTVSGDVDAENSFGAMLRTGWTCSIRVDGDTWRGSVVLDE